MPVNHISELDFSKSYTIGDYLTWQFDEMVELIKGNKSKINEKGCVGAPDMIVEILSSSSLKNDIDIKFHLYEENGVNEYWIVSPEYKQVSVYTLDENNKYFHQGDYNMEFAEEVPIFTLNNHKLKLEDIFYF